MIRKCIGCDNEVKGYFNKLFCTSECRRKYAKIARPQQAEAHRIVNNAVKRGDISAPNECERCGENEKRLNAHHEDNSKPLEVSWLCTSCHKAIHKLDLPLPRVV